MQGETVAARIKTEFEAMPLQMQAASRFILDHPNEVALLSMREQARRAGVTAATMTRLAKRLGFSGYDELKAIYADAVRHTTDWFSGRAVGMLTRREEVGETGLVSEMAQTLASYVSALGSPKSIDRFARAADLLVQADRVFCVGARASFPVAFEFSHVHGYFSDRAILLDGPGGTGIDRLRDAGRDDALLAVSFDPYARSTVAAVEIARQAGCGTVAITDSELSVIGRRAGTTIVVPAHSPSFFDTITPAFAAGEILMALIASRVGATVPEAVRSRERMLVSAGVWAQEDDNGVARHGNGKRS